MSIVFLKNLLFGRPAASSQSRSRSKSPSHANYGTVQTRPSFSPERRSSSTTNSSKDSSTDSLESETATLTAKGYGDPDRDVEATTSLLGSEAMSDYELAQNSKIDARIISDATIGLSDGLTVPFALTAGLSALGDTRVVIFGGLSELIAGAISMRLGGYLGAKSEAESYKATLLETRELISTSPECTDTIIHSIFKPYGLPAATVESIVENLQQSPEDLLSFLMRFYHELSEPASNRAFVSAFTIAAGYFIGGFVPLLPYFFVARYQVITALWWSVAVMAVALFVFGYVKTCVVRGFRQNVWNGTKAGIQMVVVGGIAAGAAMGLVKAFE